MMRKSIQIGHAEFLITDLKALLGEKLTRLPYVLRLLCENHLRQNGSVELLNNAIDAWLLRQEVDFAFTFYPNRLLMHDTTCTPALVDIAALRDVVAGMGLDPDLLSPKLPVEVSVDHSISVDVFATEDALHHNNILEIDRHKERYKFLKWASKNLRGVHINPPGSGIMHTINLEQLATILVISANGEAFPDMLLGADSHTPMINGIGVLGWGIGGLEAETVMFGHPTSISFPRVTGVELVGRLPEKTLVTDFALQLTSLLREHNVTNDFVEFYGEGVCFLRAEERAVVANMAPEYGATTGYFPVDKETLNYLARTGRKSQEIEFIQPIFEEMCLWFDPGNVPMFDRTIRIDLTDLRPTLAGPTRPQDCLSLDHIQTRTEQAIGRPLDAIHDNDVPDGAVGIAAITSCTNTSDPALLLAAGLLAEKARQHGLSVPAWVKTSLSPGSPSAELFLKRAQLLKPLSALGFDIVGYGCATCIGNSGPLMPSIESALQQNKSICAVISGNRNFPGRIHPQLKLGFLGSPALVVAYALKGHIRGDIWQDPIGVSNSGKPVYLQDIWPSHQEILEMTSKACCPTDVKYAFDKAMINPKWEELETSKAPLFPWDHHSTVLRPPRFACLTPSKLGNYLAAPLLVLGDDVTTDHISPAGSIDPKSEAGKWLIKHGVEQDNLNVFASYRGNWEVMVRGLFTNNNIVNYLSNPMSFPTGSQINGKMASLYEYANKLQDEGLPAVIFAGERYGMGSSRDWATKGIALLGCRAVIAKSFERIHRTNLIGMGILPLIIQDDFSPSTAGIDSADRFMISVDEVTLNEHVDISISWLRNQKIIKHIGCRAAVETAAEIQLLQKGGAFSQILRSVKSKCV
ncbi:MAG: aconitate hydratase AcnA [Alphaproteobacteria bacterium]